MLAANTCLLLLHASYCRCCRWTCGCWPSCECCRCSAAKWVLDSAEEGWPAPPSSVLSLTRHQSPQGCCLLVTTEVLVSIRLNWANSADPQRWKVRYLGSSSPLAETWRCSWRSCWARRGGCSSAGGTFGCSGGMCPGWGAVESCCGCFWRFWWWIWERHTELNGNQLAC